ncbi:phage terminase small subunit [Pseudomonas sp. EMN2]|uniref:phage terminase small subunit n=1 Tax=Pseudomonas sp. EMN2 TaxID=2615212 RepID=UPI00129B4302|nr:phage terminase small subunit [Pseudomonas sp. EMN2]
MTQTLAQRTRLRKLAAKDAASVSPPALMDGLTSYELMLAKLQQDQLRLKQVQSQKAKAKLKEVLLPDYVPYVDGILEAGNGSQDDVLMTVMIWRLDAADYLGGLDIAEYVLKHGMVTPDRFNRTTGCLIAEEVATSALIAQKSGSSFSRDVLTRTAELTKDSDMPDEARAKLKLALGRATLEGLDENNPGQPDDLQTGADLLKEAIALHSTCGGKKDLERAERLLKKLAGPAG